MLVERSIYEPKLYRGQNIGFTRKDKIDFKMEAVRTDRRLSETCPNGKRRTAFYEVGTET